MFYFRFFIMAVWILFGTVLFIPYMILKLRDPSLLKDYVNWISPLSLWLLKVKVRIDGYSLEEVKKHQPCVFVANHQSGLDVFTIGRLRYSRCVAVGKREVVYIPVFGWFFWACGGILINRKKSSQAINQISQVGAKIRSNNISIILLPEGTRNRKGRDFLPFKKGAFHIAIEAQVPIIPAVSSSLEKVLAPNRRKIYGGDVFVRVLPPISTQGMTIKDVDALIAQTTAAMKIAYDGLNRELGII